MNEERNELIKTILESVRKVTDIELLRLINRIIQRFLRD